LHRKINEKDGIDVEEIGGESNPEETMSLAWEVLEIARVLFEKKESTPDRCKTLILLGQLKLEYGDIEGAITELEQASILSQGLEEDKSRSLIAQSDARYWCGIAYELMKDNVRAMAEYERVLILSEQSLNLVSEGTEKEHIESVISNVKEKIDILRETEKGTKRKRENDEDDPSDASTETVENDDTSAKRPRIEEKGKEKLGEDITESTSKDSEPVNFLGSFGGGTYNNTEGHNTSSGEKEPEIVHSLGVFGKKKAVPKQTSSESLPPEDHSL